MLTNLPDEGPAPIDSNPAAVPDSWALPAHQAEPNLVPEGSASQKVGDVQPAASSLENLIDKLATKVPPVAREIAARAADVAAHVGVAAGPVAHRAAGLTEDFGGRLAGKSRDVAAGLRRERSAEAHVATPEVPAAVHDLP